MKFFVSTILCTVALVLLSTATLFAQEPITSGDYFDVELGLETQSPWTKSVPVVVRFKSNITANKVEISWDTPNGVRVVKSHPQFVSVKEGEVYSYRAKIVPTAPGTYTIAGNITAWFSDTNYSSSGSISTTFDSDLVTVPETAGYSSASIIRGVILLLFSLGAIAGLYFLSKLAINKLLAWLKPPE
jgi:hypothetical protein